MSDRNESHRPDEFYHVTEERPKGKEFSSYKQAKPEGKEFSSASFVQAKSAQETVVASATTKPKKVVAIAPILLAAATSGTTLVGAVAAAKTITADVSLFSSFSDSLVFRIEGHNTEEEKPFYSVLTGPEGFSEKQEIYADSPFVPFYGLSANISYELEVFYDEGRLFSGSFLTSSEESAEAFAEIELYENDYLRFYVFDETPYPFVSAKVFSKTKVYYAADIVKMQDHSICEAKDLPLEEELFLTLSYKDKGLFYTTLERHEEGPYFELSQTSMTLRLNEVDTIYAFTNLEEPIEWSADSEIVSLEPSDDGRSVKIIPLECGQTIIKAICADMEASCTLSIIEVEETSSEESSGEETSTTESLSEEPSIDPLEITDVSSFSTYNSISLSLEINDEELLQGSQFLWDEKAIEFESPIDNVISLFFDDLEFDSEHTLEIFDASGKLIYGNTFSVEPIIDLIETQDGYVMTCSSSFLEDYSEERFLGEIADEFGEVFMEFNIDPSDGEWSYVMGEQRFFKGDHRIDLYFLSDNPSGGNELFYSKSVFINGIDRPSFQATYDANNQVIVMQSTDDYFVEDTSCVIMVYDPSGGELTSLEVSFSMDSRTARIVVPTEDGSPPEAGRYTISIYDDISLINQVTIQIS